MDNMNEEQKIAMKRFDYAENAVKDWISLYLEEDVKTLFSDYTGENDIINVRPDEKKNYTLYLSCFPNDKEKTFGINIETAHDDIKKAASILFDSVFVVYSAVFQTMKHMKHRMENLVPYFDEDSMSFTFKMYNSLKLKKDKLSQIITNAIKNNADIATKNKYINLYNQIKDEDIKKLDDECKAFKSDVRLYMCLDVDNNNFDDEHILKRLPKFGVTYHDPEDPDDDIITLIKESIE